jgi:Signal transduction histidine kinase, glucose-6-phosphate specific
LHLTVEGKKENPFTLASYLCNCTASYLLFRFSICRLRQKNTRVQVELARKLEIKLKQINTAADDDNDNSNTLDDHDDDNSIADNDDADVSFDYNKLGIE